MARSLFLTSAASLLGLLIYYYLVHPDLKIISQSSSQGTATEAGNDIPAGQGEKNNVEFLVNQLISVSRAARSLQTGDLPENIASMQALEAYLTELGTQNFLSLTSTKTLESGHAPCLTVLNAPAELVMIAAVDRDRDRIFAFHGQNDYRWYSTADLMNRYCGELITVTAFKEHQQLWIPGEVINIGEVPISDSIVVEYPLRNLTKSPVNIDKWQTSCGCTSVNEIPDTIAPGEWGLLKIEVNAKKSSQNKNFSQMLQLQLTSTKTFNQVIPVTGTLFPGLQISPISMPLGDIAGDLSTRSIESHIHTYSPEKVQITPKDLQPGLSLVSVNPEPDNSRVRLQWEFNPAKISAGYNDSLVTSALLSVQYPKADGEILTETLPFVVHASNSPAIKVAPRGLFCGQLNTEEEWVGKLAVHSRSGQRVNCSSTDDEHLRFDVSNNDIVVKLKAPDIAGYYRADILITSGDDISTIHIMANVKSKE